MQMTPTTDASNTSDDALQQLISRSIAYYKPVNGFLNGDRDPFPS